MPRSRDDASKLAELGRRLVDRGVLVPMGAISYRFHVELFRFWLKEHTDPAEILAEVDWGRTATQLRTAAARESRAQPAPRRFPRPIRSN